MCYLDELEVGVGWELKMELFFVVRPPFCVSLALTSLGQIGWQSVEEFDVFFYATGLIFNAGDLFLIVFLPGRIV